MERRWMPGGGLGGMLCSCHIGSHQPGGTLPDATHRCMLARLHAFHDGLSLAPIILMDPSGSTILTLIDRQTLPPVSLYSREDDGQDEDAGDDNIPVR